MTGGVTARPGAPPGARGLTDFTLVSAGARDGCDISCTPARKFCDAQDQNTPHPSRHTRPGPHTALWQQLWRTHSTLCSLRDERNGGAGTLPGAHPQR